MQTYFEMISLLKKVKEAWNWC